MDAVPWAIVAAETAGLVAAIKILWNKQDAIRAECVAACAVQLAEKNTEIANLKKERAEAILQLKQEHAEEVAKLEGVIDEYKERWVKEMQHNVDMALMPHDRDEPPPESLPPPTFDEPTEVRRQREAIQQALLGQRRREFQESRSNMKAVTPPEILRRGMRGHALVRHVQTFLRTRNLYNDPIDGDFSGETEAAVKHFQDVAGIPVTGIVDSQTWGALFARGLKIPTGSRPRIPSRPR